MAEKQEKSSIRRLLAGLASLVLVLILIAVIYLAAVLLEIPGAEPEESWVVEEEAQPLTRMQAANMHDAQALAQLFGAPLPALSGYSPAGEGRNTTHDGHLARQVTLQYDGFMVTAVRPASAAPLLLRPELSISLRSDLTVMNLPAVLASREGAYCAYFSCDTAAYSIYAPAAQEEDFLNLLSKITAVQ